MAQGQNTLEILITARDEASAKMQNLAGVARQVGTAMTVVGAGITAALGLAVKAAADAEVSMAKVESVLRAMGDTSAKTRDAIIKASEATEKLGFDNDESALSIARLFQRTGDLTEAIKLNGLAMDLARDKNISLTQSSQLIGLVMSGNSRVLKQYGIDLKENTTPMEQLIELQNRLGGRAQDTTNTLTVQSQILKVELDNLQKKIGAELLPILVKLLQMVEPIIEAMIRWIDAHPKLTQAIVVVIGVLGILMATLGPILLALPTLINLTYAVGIAFAFLAANPIVLIIAGIVALVAAITYLILNWETLRANTLLIWNGIIENILKPAWESIKKMFTDGLNFIKAVWDSVWGGISTAFTLIWDGIKSTVGGAISFVLGQINAVIDAFNRARSLLSTPLNVVSNAVSTVFNAAKSAIGVKDAVITKDGQVIHTDPADYIFATKNPAAMGGAGGVVINITGNVFSDDVDRLARQLGDALIRRLNNQRRL